ncbi:MAG: Wzz/FepE/Etk N-terminal domain-containing protein [Patescibacteria group bacterium]
MNSENIFKAKNLKTIAIITILALILSLVFSFLQTSKYKSSAKLLVVYSQENIDAYAASQTANYLAGILSEVVYSSSFIDNVLKTNFDLKDNLGSSQEKRLANWKKMVKVKNQENKGIIIIEVLSRDQNQAEKFAQAITFVLINKNANYHGSGDKVSIRVIETPNFPQKPSQPDFAINTLIGLAAGLIIGFTFIFIFPEQKLFDFTNKRKNDLGIGDETIEFHPVAETKTENQSNQEKKDDNQIYNW